MSRKRKTRNQKEKAAGKWEQKRVLGRFGLGKLREETVHEAKHQYDKGIERFATGDHPSALMHFEHSLSLSANAADSLLMCGKTLLNMGRADEAIPFLVRNAEADPNNGIAHFYLGCALEATKQARRATQSYKHALESGIESPFEEQIQDKLLCLNFIASNAGTDSLDPDQRQKLEELLRLSKIYEGFPGRVQNYLREALSIDPENIEALIGLGTILWEHRTKEESEDLFNRALAQDGTALQRINSIKIGKG